MIGIYKIISPSGKIYVGQSTNIEERWKDYHYECNINTQIRIYNSIKKYGIDNHFHEILEECEESELNNRERYYQDLYDVTGKQGLNCRLTKSDDRSGKMSEETRLKMSESRKEMFKEGRLENVSFFKDKKHSEETKLKMSISQINRFKREKDNNIISNKQKRGLHKDAKKVICTKTGKIWDCIKDCAEENNLNYKTFCSQISGRYSNKTSFVLLESDDQGNFTSHWDKIFK